MSTAAFAAGKTRALDILDIGEAEERAYRWLLARPGASVTEIAQALDLTAGKVQRLLDTIAVKGLATHTPERPRRYLPVSPDIAIEALLRRRQEDLDRARRMVPELQTHAARIPDSRERMIEMITSHEVEQQTFTRMQQAAEQEFSVLTRLPMRISNLGVPTEDDQTTQTEARARGVRYRSIVDAEFLSAPGAIQRILVEKNLGEEIRVYPQLPFKMALADRRVAFIPLELDQPDSPSLLVRSSPMVNALRALFELLWERAAPLPASGTADVARAASQPLLTSDAQKLVTLMAAGLNDQKIARELHISVRTLRRHAVALMKRLGARTRFQAGWLAAKRLPDRD